MLVFLSFSHEILLMMDMNGTMTFDSNESFGYLFLCDSGALGGGMRLVYVLGTIQTYFSRLGI